MNGNQKLDLYAQEQQDFIQHFSQIVKVLTEDGMGHPEIGDAIARLKEVRDLSLIPSERESLACSGSVWGPALTRSGGEGGGAGFYLSDSGSPLGGRRLGRCTSC